MTQPEALRLADLLLSENAMDCLEHSDDAAAELRRLYEENQTLRQALAQPKSEWVGLTDEEMKKTWYETKNIMGWYSFEEIARLVETKLKEKNT